MNLFGNLDVSKHITEFRDLLVEIRDLLVEVRNELRKQQAETTR